MVTAGDMGFSFDNDTTMFDDTKVVDTGANS